MNKKFTFKSFSLKKLFKFPYQHQKNFITKLSNNNSMMKLSIYRCAKCSKIRLVDKVGEEWICFACKQNVKKPVEIKEIKPKEAKKKKKKKRK